MKIKYNSVQELKDALSNAMKNYDKGPIDNRDFWINMYAKMFNEFPNVIIINSDGFYDNKKANNKETKLAEYRKQLYTIHELNEAHTFYNLKNNFKNTSLIFRDDLFPIIINNNFIIYHERYEGNMIILDSVDYIRDEIRECIIDNKKDYSSFYYVSNSGYRFTTTEMEIRHSDIDLNDLYNDDIPHDKIMSFLKSDQSGLIMLHGEPGGGKTSYIRYLISKFPSNKFLVMDNTALNYMADSTFIDFLMEYQNHIIILEDCENMITEKRDNNIARILNLSDGLLGDAVKMKIICTFNTETKNIDPALMRKGRMKVKYEFKKLAKNKVKNLNEKLELGLSNITDMTLAEIFNHDEDNGNMSKVKKQIGFN